MLWQTKYSSKAIVTGGLPRSTWGSQSNYTTTKARFGPYYLTSLFRAAMAAWSAFVARCSSVASQFDFLTQAPGAYKPQRVHSAGVLSTGGVNVSLRGNRAGREEGAGRRAGKSLRLESTNWRTDALTHWRQLALPLRTSMEPAIAAVGSLADKSMCASFDFLWRLWFWYQGNWAYRMNWKMLPFPLFSKSLKSWFSYLNACQNLSVKSSGSGLGFVGSFKITIQSLFVIDLKFSVSFWASSVICF